MQEDRRILIVGTDRRTLFALTEALRLRLGTLSIDTAGSIGMAATLTALFHYHVIIYLCDLPFAGDEDLAVFSQRRHVLPRRTRILRAGLKSRKFLRGADGVLETPIDLERFLTGVQAAWRNGWTHHTENKATFPEEQQTLSLKD